MRLFSRGRCPLISDAPLILAVNTGSTSTKSALYAFGESGISLASEISFSHSAQDLAPYPSDAEQAEYRKSLIEGFVGRAVGDNISRIAAVGAIGGMLPPVPSGVIRVDESLAEYCLTSPVYRHASNLAAPIAHEFAKPLGIPAYAVDPVGVDEMQPVARISGSPLFPRFSFVHALNIRATAKKLAGRLGIPFDELRIVACHLGGGFSIAPLSGGRIIDSDNRMEGAPFTPERSGGIPPIPLMDACFSGRWSRAELHGRLYGKGGLYAYLGTKDLREVAARIDSGDEFAAFIYEAMIYQICKEIGAMASVLDFDLHGILVTGGAAREHRLASQISRRCAKLGTVYLYPGENENEAIAQGVASVLLGRETAKIWPDCVLGPESTDPLRKFGKEYLATGENRP